MVIERAELHLECGERHESQTEAGKHAADETSAAQRDVSVREDDRSEQRAEGHDQGGAFPWNSPEATTDGYLTMGRQLGLAIERYFREPPKKPLAE